MSEIVQGLHHVTAICGDPQRNLDFYTRALGQNFVKRTVNFDDPSVYHLYYGDGVGSAGSIMTFFARPTAKSGQIGTGQVSLTQYSVPDGALDFWVERLVAMGATLIGRDTAFGAKRAIFSDPDGMQIALVEMEDDRQPHLADGIDKAVAVRGFLGVTLALHDAAATIEILETALGYRKIGEEAQGTGKVIRMQSKTGQARFVDIHVDPTLPKGVEGAGSVHHVAFCVPDRAAQLKIREQLIALGAKVTAPINRDYFWAIYTRTPGGVLFEVATDGPGFAVDEPAETLGRSLRLPAQHEHLRDALERDLSPLQL